MTYDEVVSRFQRVSLELTSSENKLLELKTNIKSASNSLASKKQEKVSVVAHLTKFRNEVLAQEAQLKRELDIKIKQSKVKQTELEEVAKLKAQLSQLDLDIPTLAKLAREFAHDDKKVNGAKLKQALEKLGSLEKALEEMQQEGLSLRKDNNLLKQLNSQAKLQAERRLTHIEEFDEMIRSQVNQVDQLLSIEQEHIRQYELFQGFLAMVTSSPSVTRSIGALLGSFEMAASGWKTVKRADELRTLFIRAIMGDYLKSFRCRSCGASFIINREPSNKYSNYYQCPSCHSSSGVKPDDSFLKAMVS
jgi:predicted RNA-binding Zn-ribbon protein involved in translation (DUF1610 family)/myosin heavy subunit